MARMRVQAVLVALTMVLAGCTKRQVATPTPPAPQPVQNIFALLPDPAIKDTGIIVSNAAGTQQIDQPNQAVRVERSNVPPTAPFPIDQPTVTRLFGDALNALPDPEVHFVLYFDEASDALNAQSVAMMPDILRAIRDRHSTDISVTGHTDRKGTTAANYTLGLRRAETVRTVLLGQGVDATSLFVTSHGEFDLLVKIGPGEAEPRDRRVEVIVH